MSTLPIEIKGSNFTLSVIYLYTSELRVIRQALLKKIEQAPNFLKNAPIVINISKLNNDINWKELWKLIKEIGLHLVGISGCRINKQKQSIIQTGLPLLNEVKINEIIELDIFKKNIIEKSRVINKPVRSGQQIYARNSDLIVINSVSAGAELIADGNIHVYGIMRGRALAGVSGDVKCHIFCMNLYAELVSIAGRYWLSDQISSNYIGQAVKLSLLENILTIQHLHYSTTI
ncbi:Septum site-determining protein MinC [Serratia symbiotica]|nr:Septum site-determining protein MinC [Serratia symbiotica]